MNSVYFVGEKLPVNDDDDINTVSNKNIYFFVN